MAIASYNNLSAGIIKDISPQSLPGNEQQFFWTGGKNVRFWNNQVKKIGGYTSIIDTSSTSVDPYYHTRISTPTSSHYVYLGKNKVYDYFNNTHYEITRTSGDYSASDDETWSHTIINTYPIFVNYNDTPQVWNPVSQTQKLVDLPNWPTGYKCAVMRSFKAYLIAMDVTNASSVRNGNLIYWSTSALPGSIPTSWDITDLSNDSGQMELSDTPGEIIDGHALADYFVVYKKTATYVMQYTGDGNIFNMRLTFPHLGMIAKGCACNINNRQFVVTTDDIILHDGFNYRSIIDGKNRKYLFSNINSKRAHISFVVPNYARSEVWYCYPKGTSTWCNEALIYNYSNETWSLRSLPNTPNISTGFIDLSSTGTWTSYSSTIWPSATFVWGSSAYNQNLWSLTMTAPSDRKIYYMDSDDILLDNGTETYSFIERENLQLTNSHEIKTIKRIYPKVEISGVSDPTLRIEIGTQMQKSDSINWQGPYNFNIKTDEKLDVFATGRYLSIRFSTLSASDWSLGNFDVEYTVRGKW